MVGGGNIEGRALTEHELERVRAAVASVAHRYGWIQAAYLYGSAVAPGSRARDIDVGLVAAAVPSAWNVPVRIAHELEDATEIHDLPFDVRIVNGADPVFLNEMLRRGVRLYEGDREARIAFEARAMSLWLDFKPAWERTRREVLARWARE